MVITPVHAKFSVNVCMVGELYLALTLLLNGCSFFHEQRFAQRVYELACANSGTLDFSFQSLQLFKRGQLTFLFSFVPPIAP